MVVTFPFSYALLSSRALSSGVDQQLLAYNHIHTMLRARNNTGVIRQISQGPASVLSSDRHLRKNVQTMFRSSDQIVHNHIHTMFRAKHNTGMIRHFSSQGPAAPAATNATTSAANSTAQQAVQAKQPPPAPPTAAPKPPPGRLLFIKAGLPLVLFSVGASYVLKDAIEGKNKERDAAKGMVSKSERQARLEQEQENMMEKINKKMSEDFDNTRRIERPEEILERRKREREARNVWYKRTWRWIRGQT